MLKFRKNVNSGIFSRGLIEQIQSDKKKAEVELNTAGNLICMETLHQLQDVIFGNEQQIFSV